MRNVKWRLGKSAAALRTTAPNPLYSEHVSYDLQLFRRADGETTEAALARIEAAASSDQLNPGPIMPEVEREKRRLAEALTRHMSSLQRFPFDYQRIAAMENVDEAEARRKWRHIELNEDDFGLQIMLEDETASAALPYWHVGQKAQAAFRAMFGCVAVLQNEAEYFIYDPQLDRVMDPESEGDFSAALDRYLAVKLAAERAIRQDGPRQKPWWKFW
jgi:hypothetical protein